MKRIILIIITVLLTAVVYAQSAITVQADRPGAAISETMWGVFFEDINFGADGGLYAELVKNRSFEFDDPMMGWQPILSGDSDGKTVVILKEPVNKNNPRCLRLSASKLGRGFGVKNEGFRGMGIREGQSYWFSVFARTDSPGMRLKVIVAGPDGDPLMEGAIDNISGGWKNYTFKMKANATEAKAEMNLMLNAAGELDLDMASLFPVENAGTYAGRPIPGPRKDLVDTLAAMKPGFLRFPGGCIVEGITLHDRYQWKHTIGDINDRKLNFNRWNNVFKHRPTPDYFQSYGLGFYEFFLLSEQIGAEPMPILNCGMACQFLTGETVAVGSLEPYVQDALDLIEFANGPADSRWGRVRAEMGHPEPFGMTLLGVGNEQWGPQYIERYKVFDKAIREKYPEIKLIGAAGSDPYYFPNGVKEIEYLWSELRTLKADFVDEHFYASTEWFIDNAARYDTYDRRGPRVFVGEYAARGGKMDPEMRNTLGSALAEAAFMTGLERNADLVRMSAYAPLLAHVNAWQWTPNLIWFDNLNVCPTPNYYVQKLFSTHRGENVLPVQTEGDKLYVSAVRDDRTIILKVVNPSEKTIPSEIHLNGVEAVNEVSGRLLAGQPQDRNSMEDPSNVVPAALTSLDVSVPEFTYSFKPYSMTVLELDVE